MKKLISLVCIALLQVLTFGALENLTEFQPIGNVRITLAGGRTLSLVNGTDYTFTTLEGTPVWLTVQEKSVVEYFIERNLNLFNLTFQAVPVYGQVFANTLTQPTEIDWDISNFQSLALTSQTTTVLTFANTSEVSQLLFLKLTQDATGSNLATWPTTLSASGTALTLTTVQSQFDLFTLLFDGTNYIVLDKDLYVK